MEKSIGLVEYKTVTSGIVAADSMAKTAKVNIINAQTVCPGKYIVLISGELAAINACIQTARTKYRNHLIDSFILGNPHDEIFPALNGTAEVKEIRALGILETLSVASILVAADEAAKTSHVKLVEIRISKGMGGKSYLLLTGDVASVEAAIEKVKKSTAEKEMLLDSAVIANPDKKLDEFLL
jgi:bacterial microcompartment shell protein